MATHKPAPGPDFRLGVPLSDIADGATVAGRVGDKPVLLSRRGADYFAVGGACTHYGAMLADGLVEGDRAHCPWHHACFSLRTGEALSAPAFDSLGRWRVEIEAGKAFVREQLPEETPGSPKTRREHPDRIVVVGGGAAGFATVEMLRRRSFGGEIVLLSADSALPCDRPNLSKDYLAGTAPEEWLFLKDADFYRQNDISVRLDTTVRSVDGPRREAVLDGERIAYGALLLATGSTPVRLTTPGFDLPNVHTLRSVSDARAIVANTANARSVAVIGASFIALEAAAALRTRGLEVHVIAPDAVPLQRVLGSEIGALVRRIHEEHGVHFHLGHTAETYADRQLRLSDGSKLGADLVVLGVGVRPNLHLAESAGLAVNGGVVVDERMRTSDPAIFAAGDIARYRDPSTGEHLRVEHWVVAERQGQAAAAAMLGETPIPAGAPFFWSAHYDHSIRYVGHAAEWDSVEIDGSIEAADFTARFMRGGRLLAAASLGRDRQSLEIEAMMNKAARIAAAHEA